MNWDPASLVNHYSIGQIVFQWLVVLPLFMIAMVVVGITTVPLSDLGLTVLGINKQRLTLKNTLLCLGVVTPFILIMQAITFVMFVWFATELVWIGVTTRRSA